MSACTRRSSRDPTTASPLRPRAFGGRGGHDACDRRVRRSRRRGEDGRAGGTGTSCSHREDRRHAPHASVRGHARRPTRRGRRPRCRWSGASEGRALVRSIRRRGRDDRPSRRGTVQPAPLHVPPPLSARNCLSTSGRANVRFDPVRVLYRSPAGEPRVVRASWPAGRAVLAPRLRSEGGTEHESDLERFNTPVMAPWRADLTALPPVSHRSSPTLIIAVLLLAAGLLVLPACVLVYLALPWRASPSWESWLALLPPIERALAVLERARTQGDATARRRALERLGMELRARGAEELAREALELAWTETMPTSEAILRLERHIRLAGEDGRRRAA